MKSSHGRTRRENQEEATESENKRQERVGQRQAAGSFFVRSQHTIWRHLHTTYALHSSALRLWWVDRQLSKSVSLTLQQSETHLDAAAVWERVWLRGTQ